MYILWHDGKFIIGFLVLVLIVQASFGEEMAEKFCLLTLFSMLILNAETFVDFLKNNFSTSEDSTENGGASRSF